MLTERRLVLAFLLVTLPLINDVLPCVTSAHAATVYSIDLEGFRWNRFPLKVLVNMNQWSVPSYAVSVREALEGWTQSIENYTRSFNTTLPAIGFAFYQSEVNSTNTYDITISFSQNEMPPGSNVVGLTKSRWDGDTHEPMPPIEINVTTHSATTSNLFVRNVAIHELGHALGLDHAHQDTTTNGPELMYSRSTTEQAMYPSTLDVYALTRLYQGHYGETVQLPTDIPYKVLANGSASNPISSPLETFRRILPTIIILAIIVTLLTYARATGRRKTQTQAQEAPPPPEPPAF